jgi:hypothetical protein
MGRALLKDWLTIWLLSMNIIIRKYNIHINKLI